MTLVETPPLRRLTDDLRAFWRSELAALPAGACAVLLGLLSQHYGKTEAATLIPKGWSA